eukprot:gnl/MRDRNA2_/MRDRNA2_91004_c0_seq1.p1 gnl/MRDRNA2_/MRDRNA2_91004_c0~~gnl/MRDRNA2_/MRDRNA2_91004_c0_seq1.p1  ORF type:complete len:127 (+),score=23.45 gnl/MRDRNA2_/MRDRNA2_91004_c0_seq1:128-508(+)
MISVILVINVLSLLIRCLHASPMTPMGWIGIQTSILEDIDDSPHNLAMIKDIEDIDDDDHHSQDEAFSSNLISVNVSEIEKVLQREEEDMRYISEDTGLFLSFLIGFSMMHIARWIKMSAAGSLMT